MSVFKQDSKPVAALRAVGWSIVIAILLTTLLSRGGNTVRGSSFFAIGFVLVCVLPGFVGYMCKGVDQRRWMTWYSRLPEGEYKKQVWANAQAHRRQEVRNIEARAIGWGIGSRMNHPRN